MRDVFGARALDFFSKHCVDSIVSLVAETFESFD